MNHTNSQQATSPFDHTAIERHRRMGLLSCNGVVNTAAMDTFSRIHAALFYDDLLDYYRDSSRVQTICHSLIERCNQASLHDSMLNLCIEYDYIHRPLPEAIWWIAGSDVLLQPFLTGFLQWLQSCLEGEVKE